MSDTDNPLARLWEVKHSYYCNEGNYFAAPRDAPFSRYKSFDEFYASEGDSDFDMNLLFRWDWHEAQDDEHGTPFNGDENYRNGVLLLFWMGQRKGLYRWTEVEVCRADEAAVLAFLQPRLDHLLTLWEPMIAARKAGES